VGVQRQAPEHLGSLTVSETSATAGRERMLGIYRSDSISYTFSLLCNTSACQRGGVPHTLPNHSSNVRSVETQGFGIGS
jgi:hypothetical protein